MIGSLTLGGAEYTVPRARLGLYLALQEVDDRIQGAVKAGDTGGIADGIFAFLNLLLPDLDRASYEVAPWWEVAHAYQTAQNLNVIPEGDRFNILRFMKKTARGVPWDFPGRMKYVWINIFAQAYGWTIAQIYDLWPEDAVALLQEIFADDFLDREWLYGLSTVAYPYDRSTKKSRYKPLDKPLWMVARTGSPEDLITTFPKGAIPVGVIIYPEGSEALQIGRSKADDDSGGD